MKFGDIVTFDQFDSHEDFSQSRHGHRYGVVGLDIRTGFMMCRPLTTKTGVETFHQLRMWRGTDRILHCHSDGSGELKWVCKYEGITHDVTEPGDAQSNGIAEGVVQISKLGTTVALRQAGLPHAYWHWALLYHEVCWNISSHTGRDVPIPWEARHKASFDGLKIPFGAKINYVPAPGSTHWQTRRSFDDRAVVGIFLGWEMDAGCKFNGKYRVAALCDFDDTSLRESSALTARRVYSTVTSKITWPPATPDTKWEFPLGERYVLENEDGVGRIERAPRHRGEQRGPSPGTLGGQGLAPSSSPPAHRPLRSSNAFDDEAPEAPEIQPPAPAPLHHPAEVPSAPPVELIADSPAPPEVPPAHSGDPLGTSLEEHDLSH